MMLTPALAGTGGGSSVGHVLIYAVPAGNGSGGSGFPAWIIILMVIVVLVMLISQVMRCRG